MRPGQAASRSSSSVDAATVAQLDDLLLAVLAGGQVDRGGLDRRVPEEDAHVGDRRAGSEQLGRARVAQRVRVAQLLRQLGRGAQALARARPARPARSGRRRACRCRRAGACRGDEQRRVIGRGAERAGAFAVPAHDRAARRVAELHAALPVALAVAHVERAQLRRPCGRAGSRAARAAASSSQRSPASPSTRTIATVARADQRVVGDPRLGLAQQPLVLHRRQRLRRLRARRAARAATVKAALRP